MLRKQHRLILPFLKLLIFLGNKLSVNTDNIKDVVLGLTGCSLDVLNQFFSTQHSNFDLIENIRNNLAIYQVMPICLIASVQDHMVNPQIALNINELLPQNSTAIILNETHQRSAKAKEFCNEIFLNLINSKPIASSMLNNPLVSSIKYPNLIFMKTTTHALIKEFKIDERIINCNNNENLIQPNSNSNESNAKMEAMNERLPKNETYNINQLETGYITKVLNKKCV